MGRHPSNFSAEELEERRLKNLANAKKQYATRKNALNAHKKWNGSKEDLKEKIIKFCEEDQFEELIAFLKIIDIKDFNTKLVLMSYIIVNNLGHLNDVDNLKKGLVVFGINVLDYRYNLGHLKNVPRFVDPP